MIYRPKIMGILNITPDSFSDGGLYMDVEKAVSKALEMEKEGADIIDIGGESTGPNSKNIDLDEEIKRVIPVIREIKKRSNIPISVDTSKAKVAEMALAEGAKIINDVTGLRNEPQIAKKIAETKAKVIIMYAKDPTPRTTLIGKKYEDIMAEIKNFLNSQIEFAISQGIKKKNIILDPGFGHFVSKIPKYSFEIIARLKELEELKCKILIGVSRKSALMGKLKNRDDRGLIANAIAFLNGASIIRVHNVKQTKEFFENFNK